MRVAIYRSLTIFFLLLLISCGYKLLVNKKYTVEEKNGYLIFLQDYAIFCPTNDTLDKTFLIKPNNNGYRISYERLDWLDSLAVDYSTLSTFSRLKKFSIIPVRITYYLGNNWEKVNEYNKFDYKLDNKDYKISYRTFDQRYIIMIMLRRKTDLDRLRNEMGSYGH